VLASVVSLVYYLRLVKIMYFDEPGTAFDRDMAIGSRLILVVAGVVIVFFAVVASPVITAADAAAKALLP
jgi:NADH-quinone oxidoreductase subunit N